MPERQGPTGVPRLGAELLAPTATACDWIYRGRITAEYRDRNTAATGSGAADG